MEKGEFENKTVVFIDIENSKSGYIDKLINTFLEVYKYKRLNNEENEKSTIIANLQTGLSLDKIPGYLTDFMLNYSSKHNEIDFKQIFLPHKVSIEDVESLIEGKYQRRIKRVINSIPEGV